VTGLADPRAWEIRKALRAVAPVAALSATYGLSDDRAWKWRERSIERAPKVVMASMEGLDDAPAWALRERVASHCEEMLDSIIGLDDPRAWALRDRTLGSWPASVVKSMGVLAKTTRGVAVISRALAEHPGNLALWRQVTIRSA
jgi:dTMP kinase